MKVQNLTNANGRAVPNQFVQFDREFITFQSYGSTIAVYDSANKTLDIGTDWNYSRTTMKHFKRFLETYTPACDVSAENIRKAIKAGTWHGMVVVYNEELV